MDTKILTASQIGEAAELLGNDQLVAFPTETVYGLGANGLSEAAVSQVFQVKGRPADNPLILHVDSFAMVAEYVDNFHPLTEKIVAAYWPGPLTLIFELKDQRISQLVTGGLTTAAFRMPRNPLTLALIKAVGKPLVGPSANTSGKPSPTTAAHVFHDMEHKIAGILDGGPTAIGVESTVLDLSDPLAPPMILRPGAVTKEALTADLGVRILQDRQLTDPSQAPKAPGMKYKHYAPVTPVRMVRPEDWRAAAAYAKEQRIGVIAGPQRAQLFAEETPRYLLKDDSVEAAAQGLFAGLRALDEQGLALILAPVFPENDLGAAYMNRLAKASGGKYFES